VPAASPRCSRGGYQLERRDDGELVFRWPTGLLLAVVPPPEPIHENAVDMLRAEHEASGVRIDPQTSMPSWLGERLDVAYAISVLHPLACRPSAQV
jgi:hypothetical protein